MRSPWKDFLEFSRVEQVGLLILLSIILTSLVVLNFHEEIFPTSVPELSEQEMALLEKLERVETSPDHASVGKTGRTPLPEPFEFDPNSLDHQGYMGLGFSDKQAASIRRYLDKGGVIRSPEDFKKLYVVNDFMYERLKPYIAIVPPEEGPGAEVKNRVVKQDEQVREEPDFNSASDEERIVRLELNSATAEDLIALRGIGPVYAKRILSYKALLGGYDNVAQIGEVYGLKDHPEIVAELLPLLQVDSSYVTRLDINSAEWKDLVRHPYIDKGVANSIINIREVHGPYSSVQDLLRSHLIDQSLFDKISPYLMVIEE